MAALAALSSVADAGASYSVTLGQAGDVPVVGNYDNLGGADYAVWRPSTGMWVIKYSPIDYEHTMQWGAPGDIPVPSDLTGDGRLDYVVWRPLTGTWFVRDAATPSSMWLQQWGAYGDIPVPGDYTGDGRTDFAVYRPSNGTWYVLDAVSHAILQQQWGQAGDVPVPGDHDGQPGFDYSVFRPSTGQWLTFGPKSQRQQPQYRWGQTGDVPLTANFGCSDKAGQTIFRPGDGNWWSFGLPAANWGNAADVATPANFVGDYAADYAIWRPSDGKFWVAENDRNARGCADKWRGVTAVVDAAKDKMQGVAVAVVKDGQVVWSYGAGMANETHPATPDVPFQLASISKLFIATATLRESDLGHLNLDVPTGLINPYNFANPSIRQFANHTATVRKDICTVINGFDAVSNLAMAINPCFFTWPNNLAVWEAGRPAGAIYDYSNLGASWPARMVEMATNRDFAEYTQTEIFNKLGMTSTAWFASAFVGRPISNAYFAPNHPSNFSYSVSPYPVGNLRSSANDLARFMILWTSGGTFNGTQILKPATVAMALSNSTPSNQRSVGFFWHHSGGSRWGHNGKIDGVSTRLTIDPERHTGVVVLTNGRWEEADPEITKIENAAFAQL
ncbi:MAG: serine hydrolase [Kofleriaceae bacterium]